MPRVGRSHVIDARHKMKPKIVAMVSLYNSGRWLRQRFDNLMQTKTWRRGELLIYATNAGSPDPGDHDICQEYLVHRNFKYDRIGDCSVYATWNHIIKNTDTTFITNANTDDLVSPVAYDILMEACEHQNSMLAYCAWFTIGEEHKHWADLGADKSNGIGHYDPTHDQMSCGHFPVWRRELHDRIGLFDPSFRAAGDADFWYRAWQNGIRNFAPINLALGGYRWRGGQNLWNRTAEDVRSREWATLSSRKAGKLEF